MKFWKYSLGVLLAASLLFIPLTACSNDGSGGSADNTEEATSEENSEEPDTTASTFDYSEGIDDKGYWVDVTAKDYVTLNDGYDKVEIPSDVSTVTDEAVQARIDETLAGYTNSVEVTDRAVAAGDTVDIDYVGSVDGVEFDGGSTEGQGTTVVVGETAYIDDFIDQLIGHMPGETFNVEVTFPDPYENNPDLSGKDAVFVTTINYISEETDAELTDAFVAENFEADEGWKTIADMKEGVSQQLKDEAISEYMSSYVLGFDVSSVPESIIEYNKNSMINYYEEYAGYMGVEIDEFLTTYVGAESMDALVESSADQFEESGQYSLVMQAIAEDKGMTATEEDVLDYFVDYMGTEDYSTYEEQYGMNYLKQVALNQMVINYLTDNATYA